MRSRFEQPPHGLSVVNHRTLYHRQLPTIHGCAYIYHRQLPYMVIVGNAMDCRRHNHPVRLPNESLVFNLLGPTRPGKGCRWVNQPTNHYPISSKYTYLKFLNQPTSPPRTGCDVMPQPRNDYRRRAAARTDRQLPYMVIVGPSHGLSSSRAAMDCR